MMDYVQYHNSDKRGYAPEQLQAPVIYANKLPKDIIGSRVWLISGETRLNRKRYAICYVFRALGIEPSPDPAFKHMVIGTLIHRPPTPLSIGTSSWFKPFLRSVTNFSRGVTPIEKTFVDHFENALSQTPVK